MSRKMYANKIDNNQGKIVKKLQDIMGVTVELDHNDVLIGYHGRTYWFEIKNPDTVSTKTGKIRESEIKPEQKRIREDFTGHYKIVSNINEILMDLGLMKWKN